jgi:tetratricopeptide (TPR) repeat protein
MLRQVLLAGICGLIGLGLCSCTKQSKEFGGAGTAAAPAEASTPAAGKAQATVPQTDLVAQLQQVRADYKRILEVMRRWYMDHGWHEKGLWARNEMHDLKKVRTFDYSEDKSATKRLGKVDESASASLQSIDLQSLSEADMIEQLMEIRATYKSILDEMIRNYNACGDTKKAGWASTELADLNHIRSYPYLVVVDIQDTDLTPRDSIVEADRIYEEARKLHEGAKFLPFINNKRHLKEAMDKYIQIIKVYPTSDKIDDAAFYAGEISKEYFNDDVQSVKYYEMAIKWDPNTPHPARFQAAVVYDFRLHDRARAMALYQEVLTKEKDMIQSNTEFSAIRLNQLLKESGEGEVIYETETTTAAPAAPAATK